MLLISTGYGSRNNVAIVNHARKLIHVDNWCTWKFQLKRLLLPKGLWTVVDDIETLKDDASLQQIVKFKEHFQQ